MGHMSPIILLFADIILKRFKDSHGHLEKLCLHLFVLRNMQFLPDITIFGIRHEMVFQSLAFCCETEHYTWSIVFMNTIQFCIYRNFTHTWDPQVFGLGVCKGSAVYSNIWGGWTCSWSPAAKMSQIQYFIHEYHSMPKSLKDSLIHLQKPAMFVPDNQIFNIGHMVFSVLHVYLPFSNIDNTQANSTSPISASCLC